MAAVFQDDLLTTAEAGKILKVSPVTISRWIKQGRLPAYHVGPRAVRIRRGDLTTLLESVASKERTEARQQPVITALDAGGTRRLTDEEAEEALEAIREARAFLERQRAQRGGRPLPSSWQLIREAREERSRGQ